MRLSNPSLRSLTLSGVLTRAAPVLLAAVGSFMVFISTPTSAYDNPTAPDFLVETGTVGEDGANWADVLTAPRHYLRAARRAVDRGSYDVAARNLRNAAVMVSQHEGFAVGREKKRLHIAVLALRLTAKDVAAGAVTSSAQLDAVLNDTHRDLRTQNGLDP